jgi:hypothetical protein
VTGTSGIDGAVRWALRRATGIDRVFPDGVELPDDPDKTPLPAMAYRQLSGFREAYLDRASSRLSFDTYLVEAFDRDRGVCSALRDRLLAKFAGPPAADPADGAGGEADYGGPVLWNGVFVYSAEAGDPSADADFGMSDAHALFRFVQVVLSVQHLGVSHAAAE